MDAEEFRKRGEELIDYIADNFESIYERRVSPDVIPGFLLSAMPKKAPEKGESFRKILEDFEKYIIPGVTHWQHPNFHAYFPIHGSFPDILAEMLSSSLGISHFNWNMSPGGKELENIVMDWYGKMIGLPDHLLYYEGKSEGGGVILNTHIECIYKCLFEARNETLDMLKEKYPLLCRKSWLSSLVAYCSCQAHPSFQHAAMAGMVSIKFLDVDEKYRLRGETVARAVELDKKNGLIPFFVSATLGTTPCCSIDVIHEIGPVCEANKLWLHIDAAYGGTVLVCPEYKYLIKGAEYASSFYINAAKWMMVSSDCSALWVKDRSKIYEPLVSDKTEFDISDENYLHPSSKRFRVLSLFAVILNYGVEGLQKQVRSHVRLAEMFANYVKSDDRFEIINSQFGLVCFRLKESNVMNKQLQMAVNASGKLYINGCMINKKYSILFCICTEHTKEEDVSYAWSVFSEYTVLLFKMKERRRYSV